MQVTAGPPGLSRSGIAGLHHVTAIAGDPQANVDFYAGFLGLRLVKRTVNFDDPGTYHLYFGDRSGSPGSLLTFFPWPGAPRGRRGTSQVTAISLSIPRDALDDWVDRLASHAVDFEGPAERFGESVITFADPDGLQLELVAPTSPDRREARDGGPVSAENGIRGIHAVTLAELGFERTAALLTGELGFHATNESDSRFRYETGEGGPGAIVEVLCLPDAPPGRIAVGTVHHVAWRARDDAEQREWRARIAAAGLDVTPVLDRRYFHSIYFREPGGVLFEIATDPPGFALDETPDRLGERLMLPPWLERHRSRIEERLPSLRIPRST
jgi:glyoxalase family protein